MSSPSAGCVSSVDALTASLRQVRVGRHALCSRPPPLSSPDEVRPLDVPAPASNSTPQLGNASDAPALRHRRVRLEHDADSFGHGDRSILGDGCACPGTKVLEQSEALGGACFKGSDVSCVSVENPRDPSLRSHLVIEGRCVLDAARSEPLREVRRRSCRRACRSCAPPQRRLHGRTASPASGRHRHHRAASSTPARCAPAPGRTSRPESARRRARRERCGDDQPWRCRSPGG